MRRVVLAALTLTGIALGCARPAAAQSIADMTRDFQTLQTRIAAGDKAAYAAQPERIAAIGAAIAAAKPELWQSKRETDAAVIYLLSGGQPRDIVHLLETGAVPESEAPLMRGALAYTLGSEDEAVKRLGSLDLRALSLRLASSIAFAQSVLETKRDPVKAIALLDQARLLAPGTLIEEASLRREAMLASDQRDIDRVALLSRQYVQRFGASVYADAFLQALADALTQTGTVDTPDNFTKFSAFFAALSPEARRGFLLMVARTAVIDGKCVVANTAAGGALKVAAADSAEEARGKLYQGAARILTNEYDAGLAELQSVASAKLDRHDQDLLAGARAVAAFLRQPPAEIVEQPAVTAGAPAPESDSASQTITLAEAALDRTAPMVGPPAASAPPAPVAPAPANAPAAPADKGSP
ncbi:MAG: hypothetical protein E7774_01370 [Bradyrhizobium sp.]|nr:MAG: hypothetical protein E7774_01370 [Bradyrhizobium sp.]